MYQRGSKPKPEAAELTPDPLERGRFDDGQRVFVVCASSAVAPDSFQVYTKGNRADIILIVSGLTTGLHHATWSDEWRAASTEWRDWAMTRALQVFRGDQVRFCNG